MNRDTKSADTRFAPVHASKTFNRILSTFNLRSKKVLDLGCGFGEYLVEFGEGSLGVTTTVAEVEYARAKGIRMVKGNAERIPELGLTEQFDAIWSNNLFEHLLSPHAFLINLKSISHDGTLLILGVPVVPRITSLMRLRKFKGALAISHINFFTRETVALTVSRAGWRVSAVRSFRFESAFLDTLFSFFAPHVYVIAHNNAQFKYPDKKLQEWKDDPHYRDVLTVVGQASS